MIMADIRAVFYSLLVTMLLAACGKESLQPVATSLAIPHAGDIRSICFVANSTGFAAGGTFDEEGFIFRTHDGGQTWNRVFESGWCVHAVEFRDSVEGYACGDSLHILRTRDQGDSWEPVPLAWYPNPEYILPLKHISFADDTTWYFTGGRYYQYGINVRTQNGGLWLDNEVFQVELNCAYFRDANHGLLAGYGIIYSTPDANVTFQPMDFTGDNITSLSFISPMKGLACGYNGGIYSTDDGGKSWTTRLEPNGYLGRRIHFNAVGYYPSGSLAVGDDGVAYHSSDAGESWKRLDLGTGSNLNDLEFNDGHFIVAGSDGVVLRFRI